MSQISTPGSVKNKIVSSDLLDERLRIKIYQIVDLSYGGEAGFNQAIEYCSPILSNIKFVKEKNLLQFYFEEITRDSGKYVYGATQTIEFLIAGTVEKLILWENFEMFRFTLENLITKKEEIKILGKNDAENTQFLKNIEIETNSLITKKEFLSDWIIENRKNYGTSLFFVSDKTPEGNQFKKGFGGIGGILRYVVKFEEYSN